MDEHHHHHHRDIINVTDAPMSHCSHSHMHSMAFHFGFNETILFNFWTVNSSTGLLIACAITVLMCFVMESIRWLRGTWAPFNVDLHMGQSSIAKSKCSPRITTAMCTDSILHAIQLTLSYILMLLFMTFNVWICAATVFGEVSARLIFNVATGENQTLKANRADVGCCNCN